jgi:heme oxygenase
LVDWGPRRKLGLLVADLEALGDGPAGRAGIPRCLDLPPIRTSADGLGVLYVVEGSTLGGRQLRARLLDAGFAPEVCHFLGSGGRDVGRLWRDYRAATTSWVREHPADADHVVASARTTFDAVVDWHSRGAVPT